jgi:sulfite reductase alpha subunit-like flavoprotein
VDGALLPWMRKVTDALQKLFPLPESVTIDDDAAPPAPRVSIRPAPVGAEVQSQIDLDGDCFFQSTVLRNDRITTEGWEQDVRHIELELADVFE